MLLRWPQPRMANGIAFVLFVINGSGCGATALWP